MKAPDGPAGAPACGVFATSPATPADCVEGKAALDASGAEEAELCRLLAGNTRSPRGGGHHNPYLDVVFVGECRALQCRIF